MRPPRATITALSTALQDGLSGRMLSRMDWDPTRPLSASQLAEAVDMPDGRREYEARTFRIKHGTHGVPWAAYLWTILLLAVAYWFGIWHFATAVVGLFALARWAQFAERVGRAAGYEEGLNRGHAIAVLAVYGIRTPKAEKEFWADYNKSQEDRYFDEACDRLYGARQ